MADYDNIVRKPLLQHAPNGQECDEQEMVDWAVLSLVRILSKKRTCRAMRTPLNM